MAIEIHYVNSLKDLFNIQFLFFRLSVIIFYAVDKTYLLNALTIVWLSLDKVLFTTIIDILLVLILWRETVLIILLYVYNCIYCYIMLLDVTTWMQINTNTILQVVFVELTIRLL